MLLNAVDAAVSCWTTGNVKLEYILEIKVKPAHHTQLKLLLSPVRNC